MLKNPFLPYSVLLFATHMPQRRCSSAVVDIDVLEASCTLRPDVHRDRRGNVWAAGMSVCDAISGVDAMMNPNGLKGERGTGVMTPLLKDPGRRQFQGRAIGDHIQCAKDGNLKEGRSRGAAHKKDGTPLCCLHG